MRCNRVSQESKPIPFISGVRNVGPVLYVFSRVEHDVIQTAAYVVDVRMSVIFCINLKRHITLFYAFLKKIHEETLIHLYFEKNQFLVRPDPAVLGLGLRQGGDPGGWGRAG